MKPSTEVVYAALLHDIGKLIMRAKPGKETHSVIGHSFIKDFFPKDVCDAVLYHHSDKLKAAHIENDSIAYIIYEADNLSSKGDRRKDDTSFSGFERDMPLYSIFNLLNDKDCESKAYAVSQIDINKGIVYAEEPEKARRLSTANDYLDIFRTFENSFKSLTFSDGSQNALLQLLESTCLYIPSSTAKAEVADISLFDHSKLTAAFASCMYAYCSSKGITDYKSIFFDSIEFRKEKVYLLFNADFSGIQNFVYGVSSKGALKSLRGRSFYLELMSENIIDEMLDALNLSRVNLLYNGGGNFYMLLPNTEETITTLEIIRQRITDSILKEFDVSLYLAFVYQCCSAEDLVNTDIAKNTLGKLYSRVGADVSYAKLSRYNKNQLENIFNPESKINMSEEASRECSVCHTSSKTLGKADFAQGDVCELCRGMYSLGSSLTDSGCKGNYICAMTVTPIDEVLSAKVVSLSESLYATIIKDTDYLKDEDKDKYIRIYSVDNPMVGINYATNIWAGVYSRKNKNGNVDFGELADSSDGITRLGVLRADIDNLGTAFKSGFTDKKEGHKYVTLSRFATLSRELNFFFKYRINYLCESNLKGLFHSCDNANLSIVYSGGDDLFVVGAWNEVLDFGIALNSAIKRFTNGKLTLSAGFGMFKSTFPIYQMALITGRLEQAAKENDGGKKDSIALFGFDEPKKQNAAVQACRHVYRWEEFLDEVVEEKFVLLNKWFDFNSEESAEKLYVGNSFLYRIMELYRNASDNRISIARLAYTLGRMEPSQNETELKSLYRQMCEKMMEWINDPTQAGQALTALNLIVYCNRKGEDYADDVN